jgi:hypothetical protein
MILFSQMRENIRQKYGIEKPTGKVSTEKKLWFVSFLETYNIVHCCALGYNDFNNLVMQTL